MHTVGGHQGIGARSCFPIHDQSNSLTLACNIFGDIVEKESPINLLILQCNITLIQMDWGAMSAAGTMVVHILAPGMTINAAKYTKVSKEKLQMRTPVHQCNIFMHVSAPFHKGVIVMNFSGGKIFDCWAGPEIDQA